MIRAVIFDLDGTLVQTERLKAISYAKAAVELCPHDLSEPEVLEAFRSVVGKPRREVAQSLVQEFDLSEAASKRAGALGVETDWQAFVQIRLRYYDAMLRDAQMLREHRWPHTVALLDTVRMRGCIAALATMSRCEQAIRVLSALELGSAFAFVATRDDVENGKPDPEIYLLVAEEIGVQPGSCLVIEDSPPGVEAALAANMHCIAVSTPFTQDGLHASGLLETRWIVDEPGQLARVAAKLMDGRKNN